MKTRTEFDTFYSKHLNADIEALEQRRAAIAHKFSFKRYGRWLLILVIVTPVVIITVNFIPGLKQEQFLFLIFFTILYAILAPIYIFIRRNWVFDNEINKYKRTIVPKVVHFVGDRLTYDPAKGISLETFMENELFERPTAYQTEDLVEGIAGTLKVQFADVNATKKISKRIHASHSTKHNESTDTINIFYGLYTVVELRRAWPEPMWIDPKYVDSGNKLLDALGGSLLKIANVARTDHHLPGEPITTGHARFDELFAVRAQNIAAARRAITPALVNLLLACRDEAAMPVYLAIRDKKLHIGFSGMNFLEVDAHTTINRDKIFKYVNVMNFAIGLGEYFDQAS